MQSNEDEEEHLLVARQFSQGCRERLARIDLPRAGAPSGSQHSRHHPTPLAAQQRGEAATKLLDHRLDLRPDQTQLLAGALMNPPEEVIFGVAKRGNI